MILTEEEAKTKRCQESFGDTNLGSGFMEPRPAISVGSYGSSAISTSPQACIGSACMAWRWKRGSIYRPIAEQDKKPKDHPEYADFIEIEGKGDYSATHGYCGKAGKP